MFKRETTPFRVTDDSGYIINKYVRRAYEHLCDSNALHGGARAEAFLRMVERCAARGIRLYAEGE